MPWLLRVEADEADVDAAGREEPGKLEQFVGTLMANWPDARIKTFLTACGTRLRRREAALFLNGEYEPLRAEGEQADRLVAFARFHAPKAVIAAVPRLTSESVLITGSGLPAERDIWKDTRVLLPAQASGARFRHLFTGALLQPAEAGGYLAADLFRTCPVALLIAEPGH
jgi:(1->4)-alpha-D-glucan 1-alpha-D-glucosylmutase